MVPREVEHVLPPRLGALLALELDVPFADRLRRVLEAASRAISKLGELDLIKYEDSLPIDSTADLSLWEEVAPVVGETIANVNAVTAEIDRHFPESEVLREGRQQEVRGVIRNGGKELRGWVSQFGMRVRDPSVVGDRWNLITELQMFRFKFRNRIGHMVFEAATLLGDCKRREVEPGYDEALASALVVRSTTADLRRLMHSRIHKVGEAASEDLEWNLTQIDKELNAFGRTAAWRALRAQDKKMILEFRGKGRELKGRQGLAKIDVLQALEPFVEYVDTFKNISQRELLLAHDQEVLASVGVVLERALSTRDYKEQLSAFTEAVGFGQSLYGRSEDFDAFLRKLRKTPPTAQNLAGEVEQFFGLLASLMNA
jgi:hypothetical protein